jgi:hypothetical protein
MPEDDSRKVGGKYMVKAYILCLIVKAFSQ